MQRTDRIDRWLNPRDLQIFAVVAEHGNISKAADSLAISRPVISRMIANLERTLGVPLFDRSPQGVEPTLYGRALRRLAVTVFDDLRQGMQEIEFLADPTAGELRIGCNESMTAGLVTAAIGRLSRRYPKLIFHMELGNSEVLQLRTLRERNCEFVVARQIAPQPDMDAEALFHEQPLVWVGPRSKWLGRRKIGLAELADQPWILTTFDVQPGAPLFEAFRAAGLPVPQARITGMSFALRNTLMATGHFLTLIPDSMLEFGPKPSSINVLPVALPRWQLPIAIITLKNRTLGPVAQLLIGCIRELAEPLAKREKSRVARAPTVIPAK
jgi:DNA-binding transcriptional LysR family regulator